MLYGAEPGTRGLGGTHWRVREIAQRGPGDTETEIPETPGDVDGNAVSEAGVPGALRCVGVGLCGVQTVV